VPLRLIRGVLDDRPDIACNMLHRLRLQQLRYKLSPSVEFSAGNDVRLRLIAVVKSQHKNLVHEVKCSKVWGTKLGLID